MKKIWTAIRDVYFLLFCYSSECQFRAQKKKNISKGEESGLEKFSSYAELRRYQKRMRTFMVGMLSFGVIFSIIFFVTILFLVQYLCSLLHIENNIFDWKRFKESFGKEVSAYEIGTSSNIDLIIK